VSHQRLFGRRADGFRLEDASGLTLVLLDELVRFLVGNPLP
jgi:hypothetical protein